MQPTHDRPECRHRVDDLHCGWLGRHCTDNPNGLLAMGGQECQTCQANPDDRPPQFWGLSCSELIQIGPPLAERAVRLAEAMAAWAKDGFRKATSAEVRRRRSICAACEHSSASGSVCNHSNCGCVIAAKSTIRIESCPAGKW